ncbi:MAG: class I SAM-dependent methyltransferase [Chloroflexota bacterium]
MQSGSVVFDRAVGFYDETRGFPPGVETHVADLLQQAGGLTKASKLIEIGVGTGRIALPLAPHVKAIYGVDLSRAMMLRLREKQTDEPIALAEGDITRLPFPANTFDAAVAVHIFHLVSDWRGAVDELARVLRPDAVLLSGGNTHDGTEKLMRDAMRQALPADKRRNSSEDQPRPVDLPTSAGWQLVGEPHVYRFKIQQSIAGFLERVKGRTWSILWQLDDTELAHCVDAVRAAIEVEFGDANRVIESESSFEVRVFMPPRSSSPM